MQIFDCEEMTHPQTFWWRFWISTEYSHISMKLLSNISRFLWFFFAINKEMLLTQIKEGQSCIQMNGAIVIKWHVHIHKVLIIALFVLCIFIFPMDMFLKLIYDNWLLVKEDMICGMFHWSPHSKWSDEARLLSRPISTTEECLCINLTIYFIWESYIVTGLLQVFMIMLFVLMSQKEKNSVVFFSFNHTCNVDCTTASNDRKNA